MHHFGEVSFNMLPETGKRYSFFNQTTRQLWGPLCSDCLNGEKYKSLLLQMENDRTLLLYEHEKEQFRFRCFTTLLRRNGLAKPFNSGRSTGISLACSNEECKSPNSPPAYKMVSSVQTEVGYVDTTVRFYDGGNSKTRAVSKPIYCQPTTQRFSYLNLKTIKWRGPFCAECINGLCLEEIKALHSAGDIVIVEHLNIGCRTRALMSFQMQNLADPAERPFIASLVPKASQPCVACLPKKANTTTFAYVDRPVQLDKSLKVSTVSAVKYGFGVDINLLFRKDSKNKHRNRSKNGPTLAPSDLAIKLAAFRTGT